jgi:hypothetical protein
MQNTSFVAPADTKVHLNVNVAASAEPIWSAGFGRVD